jgi:hypothetical protein
MPIAHRVDAGATARASGAGDHHLTNEGFANIVRAS